MISGRVISDAPADGPWNMAVDQSLLEEVNRGAAPLLRLYRWKEPTLSLGYFQRLGDRDQHAASSGVPVVRRSTGGGAILHDAELTYSLCLPIRDRTSDTVRGIYDDVHQAILATLADFGVRARRFADVGEFSEFATDPDNSPPTPMVPFLCFQRRTAEDLVIQGYKVVGSAQRRAARGVLQHGSILLAASQYAPELPGVRELTSLAVPEEDLAKRLIHHLGLVLGIEWSSESLARSAERVRQEAIGQIVRHRFSSLQWTAKR